MKHLTACVLAAIVILPCVRSGYAQSGGERKFEVGAQFSILEIRDPVDSFFMPRIEPGFGGRFVFNLNRHVAFEAEGNLFPRNFQRTITPFTGGRVIQGLFGVKAGVRRQKIGFFGKARPGFVSSGHTVIGEEFPGGNGPDPNNRFGYQFVRATQLAMDLGGVVEYYPSPRTILRFDIGDTVTKYIESAICFPAGVPCKRPRYTHEPQFSVGVGFRF